MRRKKRMHNLFGRQKKADAKPSMRDPVIAEDISRKMQISEDILAGAPIVTSYGYHRLCIENYRNMIDYQTDLIRLQTKTGKLYVFGKRLSIAYYRNDSMCILGDIHNIEFHH